MLNLVIHEKIHLDYSQQGGSMGHTYKQHPFFKRTWVWIFLFVALFLIFLRMVLPNLIVAVANRRLSNESPNFALKIGDVDLYLLKGRYVVKNIDGTIKSSGQRFLHINTIANNIPWKNLLKGKMVADVIVNKADVTVSQELLDKAQAEKARVKEKYLKKDESKKEPKLLVRSFKLNDSNVSIQDFMSFKGDVKRKISDINMIAANLVPTKNDPQTDFEMTANVFGPAPLKVWGVAKLREKPLEWDMNAELKKFELRTLNPLLKEKTAAFIHKGRLDEYIEMKSSDGVITGHMKPFVSKLKMDAPPGGFQLKGETAAAGGNMIKLLLTDSEAKTLATEIPFKYTNKIEVDVIPVLTKAVEHRAKDTIKPGIENKIELGPDTMQAEEEKKE